MVKYVCSLRGKYRVTQTILWTTCHRVVYRHRLLFLLLGASLPGYGRFPDGYFPGCFFPGKSFPGWSLSRKDVSRVVIFPDDTFPGKTSWMVGLIFNCSWRWSLTERPYCGYLNGFTVNSPHCQFAPTNSSQVNMGRVGIQCLLLPGSSSSNIK